jgi:hypothetical protein
VGVSTISGRSVWAAIRGYSSLLDFDLEEREKLGRLNYKYKNFSTEKENKRRRNKTIRRHEAKNDSKR